MKKPTIKNLSFIHIDRENSTLTYEINHKQLGTMEKIIEIKTPFSIIEHGTELNKIQPWNNIFLNRSIAKIFNDIVKIEIWFGNGRLYNNSEIIKDTILIFTKNLRFDFDQLHVNGKMINNHQCCMVKNF